jgi:hypothetical protein
LDDREVDFGLVEPAGVDGGVHEDQVLVSAIEYDATARTDCGVRLTNLQMQTCMAQLVTGGWSTINIYAGQPACAYGSGFWYSVTQYSVSIALTYDRWYSTWTWLKNNGNKGQVTIVPPEDTPGVCIKDRFLDPC